MKSLSRIFVLVCVVSCSFVGAAYSAGAVPASQDLIISINDAFIPSGFDTGSDAFVVISGLMPNGCYHYKGSTVKNVSTTVHEVTATATVSSGMCPMVILPYSRDVQLGKLVSGDHTVRFLNGDGTYWEKHLTVE